MKLSLSWIFDYIDADWLTFDMNELVYKFNTTTAEIEHLHEVRFNLDEFTLVEVSSVGADQVIASSLEWAGEYILPARADAKAKNLYLIRKAEGVITWATMRDWGAAKDGLINAVSCPNDHRDGSWKNHIVAHDYILEVDNKSITNRPDLWCHRGFAREIAAILDVPFKDFEPFLAQKKVTNHEQQAEATDDNPFTITLPDNKACSRFAGLYIPEIKNQSSLLWIASRLLRVDSKPIDMIVDLTNYVMLDMSQPMHAFDAAKLPSNAIALRFAKRGEKLVLLDGQKVELAADDFVITDGARPVALAGIMGGADTAVSADTRSLFLEAASFNPSMVRISALNHKIRTDASARFEKSLDPNQNLLAIRRLLKLLDDANISYQASSTIASVGQYFQDSIIDVPHAYIEKLIGVEIAPEFVKNCLEKIDFGVESSIAEEEIIYAVRIPTFRGTKDVINKEDVVEEVIRFFGYDNIPLKLPSKQMQVSDLSPVYRLREIKNHMAFALKMREIDSYSFFDEAYLQKLSWEPKNPAVLKNPISQNWQHLATSLVPHLLNAIEVNATHDQLRFFEWARLWNVENQTINEQRCLASCMYDAKGKMSFYDAKELISSLFHMLQLPIEWQKSEVADFPWYDSTQTAFIMHEGNRIGTLGSIDTGFLKKIVDQGSAFVCELDGDFLLAYNAPLEKFNALPKFPNITLDISARVPLSVTVHGFKGAVQQADSHIVLVDLVDVFQNADWKDTKAITMRFVIQDKEKTLSRADADAVWEKVADAVKKLGGQIR